MQLDVITLVILWNTFVESRGLLHHQVYLGLFEIWKQKLEFLLLCLCADKVFFRGLFLLWILIRNSEVIVWNCQRVRACILSVIWMKDFKFIGTRVDFIFILSGGEWLLLEELFSFSPYFFCLPYRFLLFLSVLPLNILHLLLPVLIQHLYLLLHILLMFLPIQTALLHLLLDLKINFFGLVHFFLIDLIQVVLYLLPLGDFAS